ncbi:hypothetical protein VKT23_009891 [Stygiomarasmius scandens]|uniref:Cytochrome P450 n=1 Tax=Marasmiellus scandens TaxID=2682957 RepID=A0ABR1JGY7_9AGAR
MSFNLVDVFVALVSSITLAFIGFLVSRFLQHPLNKFPGPPIARWTTLYRAYYDLVKKGAWLKHLEELHKVYGPIVRVAPNELHFSDPRVYGEIYSPGSRFYKDPVLYGALGGSVTSVFTTPDPREAAISRNILAPFFSRRNMSQREVVIRDNVKKLISRLTSFGPETQLPANLDNAIPSTALDVLTSLIFSRSFDMLSVHEFDHPFVRREKPGTLNLWLAKYLPDPNTPFTGAFTRLMSTFNPFRKIILAQTKLIRTELDLALEGFDLVELRSQCHLDHGELTPVDTSEEVDSSTDTLYSFIFRRIREQVLNRENSKSTLDGLSKLLKPRQLISEAINLRFAGTDTIASACLVALRYILTRKEVLGRLVEELDAAWTRDSEMTCEALEKLPYLTAVIKESLRLSHGVVSPKGRIVGPCDAVLAGQTIPAGTIVGISSTFVHLNPELFPEPKTFNPQRWLDTEPNTGVNSEKYLVSFSRGPRSCLGIHLAWCELYILLGYLFRHLELVLSEKHDPNSPLDFDDFFLPVYKDGPLRVFAKERILK